MIYKNLLAVRLSSLGDIIRSIPSLFALKEISESLTFLTEDRFEEILKLYPIFQKTILFPRKKFSLKNLIGFFSELYSYNFDVTVDLHGIFKSAIITHFSKSERKIGFDEPLSKEFSHIFYKEKVSGKKRISRYERYEILVKYLKGEVQKERFYEPKISKEALTFSKDFVRNELNNKKFAFFFPGTSKKQKFKRWPLFRLIPLANKVRKELEITPVFCLGPQEQEFEKKLFGNFVIAKGLNLEKTASLILKSQFFVGSDTGLMHLSALSGVKTFAIMGATDPLVNKPWGEKSRVIFKEGIFKECKGEKCSHTNCMAKISFEEVFEEIKNAL